MPLNKADAESKRASAAALEAVLIPGGGLGLRGELPPWVQARLDRAIALTPRPQYFIPLSAGTTHKPPPLDALGFPMLESVAAGRYLAAQGIAGAQILPETISLDTIGNAYFARVQHTEPLGLRRLHVITSAFHRPRTEAIFRWIFALSSPAVPYALTFEAVSDVGIAADVLAERCERERASLARVNALKTRFTTLSAVHRWLYDEHAAYAIAHIPEQLSSAALDSY
ncbi:MAG: ElyC/SanA/YdcF family protein [Cyanobacteria bacterium J06607_6]